MTNAGAISRFLKKAGFMITATRMREGILVTGGVSTGFVYATATYDSESRAKRMAAQVVEALREGGYSAKWDGEGPSVLCWKEEPLPAGSVADPKLADGSVSVNHLADGVVRQEP